MAISYTTVGSASVGTASCSPATPAAVNAGDLLIVCITNKYLAQTPTVPTGYVQLAQINGGYSTTGIDSGDVTTTIFYRIADGSEDSASNSVTITGGNSCIGHVSQWSKAAGKFWDIAAVTGVDETGGSTAWSVTSTTSLQLQPDDAVAAYTSANADTYTYSAHGLSSSGITFGTVNQRYGSGTTQGHDCYQLMWDALVSSGSGTNTVTATATSSGFSSVNTPLGSAVIVRLREVDIPPRAFFQNQNPVRSASYPSHRSRMR